MSNSPLGLFCNEARRAQAAVRIRLAAAGAVRDLDAFSGAGEQDRVVADDVAAADRRKADRPRPALAGVTFARVDREFRQRPPERAGDDLAHLQRGARWGIDLVAMVCLDDLDVVALIEHACRHFHQLEGRVDADAHVRREHDGDALGRSMNRALAGLVEPRRADHHPHAGRDAGIQVLQCRLRASEIDEHISRCNRGEVGADAHSGRAPERFGAVAAEHRAVRTVQRDRNLQIGLRQRSLDQHLPHFAGGAGDRELHGCGRGAVSRPVSSETVYPEGSAIRVPASTRRASGSPAAAVADCAGRA